MGGFLFYLAWLVVALPSPAGASHGVNVATLIARDFEAFDPSYPQKRSLYESRLAPLGQDLADLQQAGHGMACTEQIFIEARWLVQHTARWQRLEDQIRKLEASFDYEDQDFAGRQSASDGAWGACYTEWFMKLDATVTELNARGVTDRPPDRPLNFLSRIADPDSLGAYLEVLKTSDIATTGRDQRDELNAVTAALSQLLFKPRLRRYLEKYVPGFESTGRLMTVYLDFLDSWQDAESGFWGAWYRSDDHLSKASDLSITFHVISYRRGNVARWPEIVTTLLAIRSRPYPYGWLHEGKFTHHNNYGVAKILRYGWPVMKEREREQARSAIESMMEWCFTQTTGSGQSFAIDPTFYSNPANYYYFGVQFLAEVGYWDRSRRFWTDREFPDAEAVCRMIASRLRALDLKSEPAQAAAATLAKTCPDS